MEGEDPARGVHALRSTIARGVRRRAGALVLALRLDAVRGALGAGRAPVRRGRLPRVPPMDLSAAMGPRAERGARARRRGSSATCRSTSPSTVPTSRRTRRSSTSTRTAVPPPSPAFRPTRSARRASSGAIRSIAGTFSSAPASPGGSSVCVRVCDSSISFASITSAGSPRTGRSRPGKRRPSMADGFRGRAGRCSRRCGRPSADCLSWPRTSA